MNASWRSLRPGFFLRDNVYALFSLLLSLVLLLTVFQSNAGVDPHFPQHAWAAQETRIALGFFLLTLSAALATHYWRCVQEPLTLLVPGYRRGHHWLFTSILLLLLLLATGYLLYRDATPLGAFLIAGYFILGGIFLGSFQNSVGQKPDSARRVYRLFLLLPLYFPIYFGAFYWTMGTRPVWLSLPIDLVWLWLLWRLLQPEHPPGTWLRGLRAGVRLDLGQWSWLCNKVPHWGIPERWFFPPSLWSRPCYSLLSLGSSQAVVSLLLLFLLERYRFGAALVELFTSAAFVFWALPSLRWGNWFSQAAEWQYAFTLGPWGGNRQSFLQQWIGRFTRHSSVLSLYGLLIPAVTLAILGVAPRTIAAMTFLLFVVQLANARFPLGMATLGIHGATYRLLLSLGLVGNLLLGRTLAELLLHAQGPERASALGLVYGFALCGLLLAWAFTRAGSKRLDTDDWTLIGLRAFRGASREHSWGWPQGLAVMLLFGGLQLLVGVIAAFLWSARVGFVRARNAARLHEHLSPLTAHAIPPMPLHWQIWVGITAYFVSAILLLGYLLYTLSSAQWRGAGPGQLGWRRPDTYWSFLWALLLGLLIAAIYAAQLHWFPAPTHLAPRSMGMFDALHQPGPSRYVVLLLLAPVAPFVEEILFRGAGLAGLRTRLSAFWASVWVTLLFVLIHAPSKVENFHYPLALLPVLLLAIALVWLRLRYRSLWPGVFLHLFWNGTIVVLVLAH
ncbi:CPBP family intramembrane glutamic endopeptidase [Acidithiobacillus sp. AMEEHan]|uniref:CPBP family intramembrane glutamic endopeptidase n=1 Tax=Acidithiobacillus sp. AMEEHan TaxID=2994951 RepID=UPI0027E59351|nr:CPBP family intramembrane glutamic endopeptidase [Acidithiobacillus sp. AMEEHan]